MTDKKNYILSQLPGWDWEKITDKFYLMEYFEILEFLDHQKINCDNHDLAMMIYYELGSWVSDWK